MRDLKILQKAPELHEARWWEPEPNGKVHCYLCPRHCHIGAGAGRDSASSASNEGGKLYSLGYAHPAALQIDPIEKKPLNHFLPGTRVFLHGHRGMQHGLLLLPELGHLEVAFRPGAFHLHSAGRRGAAGDAERVPVDRVHLQRADDLGRVRDRYLRGGERSRAEHGDGIERLRHRTRRFTTSTITSTRRIST